MIEQYLKFAQEQLSIKDPLFQSSYLIQSPLTCNKNTLGRFNYKIPLIFFNGEPSSETVFHEAVHWRQFEKGFDFKNAEMEYFGVCCDVYRRKSWREVEWLAYYSAPWEIEARKVAAELEVKFRLTLALN